MDIFPIPPELIFFHGIFKLICAGIGCILLIMLFQRYLKKKSKIALAFIFVFLSMILSFVFSSFDNLLNWDNLLGPETWIGFGISQILIGVANVVYYWLFIEIFKVKEKWTRNQKLKFLGFVTVYMMASVFIMTYYAFGFPPDLYVPSLTVLVMSLFIYFFWISECGRILTRLDNTDYIYKFRYLRLTADAFLAVMAFSVIASLSSSPSYASWIAMLLTLIGVFFGYRSIIKA